jgi:hypothetical protein
MFRRFRPFACLVTACFLTLLVSASPAVASLGVVPKNLEPLWKAYPLNSTSERLVKTNVRPFVPPTAAALEASDRDGRSMVSRARLLMILCAALIPSLLLCVLFRLSWLGSGGRLLAFSFIGGTVAAEVLWGYAVYTVLILLL